MNGLQESLTFGSAPIAIPPIGIEKECLRCGLPKDLSVSGKDKRHKDGRESSCKDCISRYNREYHTAHRDHILTNHRVWLNDNKDHVTEYRRAHREKISEHSRSWIVKNPEKATAYRKVRNAIKSGVLDRLPCEVCGSKKSHAHHDDYNKPFEVKWLCATHHYWYVKGKGKKDGYRPM